MAGSAFNPAGFGRRGVAIAAGMVLAAGAAGVGWWQTHLATSPSCQITAPGPGTISGTVTLSATCGASATGVTFDAGSTQLGSAATAPFSVSWNSALLANGTYPLTAVSQDANGNSAISAAVSITTSNASAPVNTVAPAASGATTVGDVLSCTTGTWTGDVSSGYTYQWKDGAGNIAGATSSSYTIGSGETGATIHCTVTATGTGGSAAADSNTVGPISAAGSSSVSAANIWVAQTAGASPSRSSSQVAFNATHAYGSFQAAYSAAQTGDVIGYTCDGGATTCYLGSQTISTNNAGLTNYVTFAPQTGVDPQFGCHVTLASTYVDSGASQTIQTTDASCFGGQLNGLYFVPGQAGGGLSCSSSSTSGGITTFTGCIGGLRPSGCSSACQWFSPCQVYASDSTGPRGLTLSGVDWIKLEGYTGETFNLSSGASNVILDHAYARFLGSWGNGVSNVTVTNSTIGDDSCSHITLFLDGASNITFSHDVFRNVNGSGETTAAWGPWHGEVFYLEYVNGLTIDHSEFVNNAEYHIFTTAFADVNSTYLAENVHLENDFFGPMNNAQGANSCLALVDNSPSKDWHDWTVDYNTFDCGTFSMASHVTAAGHAVSAITMTGNYGVMPDASCESSFTYDDDVWVGNSCSGDRSSGTLSVVSTSMTAPDLHLTAGASAVGQGDPASYPATDYDGCTRTSPPDAGADQYGCP